MTTFIAALVAGLLAASITPACSQGLGPRGSGGQGTIPSAVCGDSTHALAWNGSTYTCQAITASGTPGGSTTQVQRNNAGALGGISGVTSNGTKMSFSATNLELTGSTSGAVLLNAPATSGGTLTLPPGTDTLAGLAATQTFTNKSIDAGQLTGSIVAGRMPALTGDITSSAGAVATTLATVNSNVGSFTAANITVNAKGLITAASSGSSSGVSITTSSPQLVVAPSPLTGTGTIDLTVARNAQTGTSYALQTSDAGKIVSASNGSAQAYTIAVASTTGFTAGFGSELDCLGAGTVTLTATTSTFDNGLNAVTCTKGQDIYYWSDTTNYHSAVTMPVIATSTLLGNSSGASNYPTAQTVGSGVLAAMSNALSAAGGVTTTVASGTSAMGTSAISSGACATVVTTSATNTATTDTVLASFNGDPTAVTGYAPTTNGMLTIIGYPSTNNVNFKVCNNTSASVTPGAITLNWRILR